MSQKILIIRFSSLGDVVLTTSLLPNLKAKWPESEVVVLTKAAYADVFAGNPHVDRLLTFSSAQPFFELCRRIRRERFDIIFDLHGNFRSWLIRVLAGPPLALAVDKVSLERRMLVLFKRAAKKLQRSNRERILDCLSAIAVPIASTETQLYPQNVAEVRLKFELPSVKNLLGVAPGARHATKRWPAERYADAANRLAQKWNATIVLLGTAEDRAAGDDVARQLQAAHLNLIGKTSLSELIAVTSELSFLLTNDSGLLHLGEALRIPLVVVFGPTVREFGFAPYRSSSVLIESLGLSCRPCTLHGDPVCPLGHHLCMKNIDVDRVFRAALSAWDAKSGRMAAEQS